jgi:hypothetical protein
VSVRRWTIALLAVLLVVGTFSPPTTVRAASPIVRDLGPLLGLRQHESSYSIAVGDANGDGWDDVLIDHHGSRPAELFQNQPDGEGGTLGFEVALRLIDTIHARPDRHGCLMGDPNADGLTDILCLKGGQQGHGKKWNEFWVQGPAGTWADEAAAWGVEDVYGRGRFPSWIDLNHDAWPDLFVGNDTPRHDRHSTADRLYENVEGTGFREVNLGVTEEFGADCVQVADVNDDGWDDLLICGSYRTYLFLRQGDRFIDATIGSGIAPEPKTNGAWLGDLNDDGVIDLVLVHPRALTVQIGTSPGSFDPPVLVRALAHGHGLAVGDVDGIDGPDIYAVDGCAGRVNQPDLLLLNGGDGQTWSDPLVLPPLPDGERAGCGDQAAMVDFDRDGRQEIAVTNGGGDAQPLDLDGPDQLLTLGDWMPRA